MIAALTIYFMWLLIRIPILLVAYKFHQNPLAKAIIQFG